jgi:membrane protease YdiL (CAAX protease family)
MTVISLDDRGPSLARRIVDNRLVRFLLLFVITTAAYAGAQVVPFVAMPHIPAANRETFAIATSALSAIALLAIYTFFVRLIERRSVSELAPRAAPGGIVAGVIIGLGLFSTVIAILTAMGIAHIAPTPGQPLLGAANMAVLSAIGEELVFRGVVYRVFEEMFGTAVALVVSAGFFGAIHLINPGATIVSGAAIAIEAGALLAIAYVAARNLWLPMGLHFGWNFAESAIFGSVVSGNAFKGLFHTTLTGSDLMTGGKFGPEASVVAVAVCAMAAFVLLIIAIHRGEWKDLRLSINDRG